MTIKEIKFDDQFKSDIDKVLDSLFNELESEEGVKFLTTLNTIFHKHFSTTEILILIPQMRVLGMMLSTFHIMSLNRNIPDEILAEFLRKRLKEKIETHMLSEISKGKMQ